MAEGKWFPSLKELFQMGSTFFFTMIAWVFFRSENIISAFNYLIFTFVKFELPNQNRSGIIFIVIIIFCDWLNRKDERNIFSIDIFKSKKGKLFLWSIYYITFSLDSIFPYKKYAT